ncbi:gluconokinase [Foetidibacter luteolus]|uniref:gluconokinase n=1 Tax=Foetidibacter luteolus TaxID=2608880 RepID=UPI001A9863D1|nr:gluconokinase [Foetidibacter luteolus]
MQHILALDLGTTHCKAVIINTRGDVIKKWQAPSPFISKEKGQHEQEAEAMLQAVTGLLQQAFTYDSDSLIGAVSFSAAMHGLMAVDANGSPLTNIITWADTRSAADAEMLLANKDAALKIYSRTGPPIHSMTPLCKLLWLKRTQPALFGKAHKFIGLKEYIFFNLFGSYVIDYSIASATGLFDIYSRNWNPDALALTGITANQLSKPVDITHTETAMLPKYRQLFQLNRDVPFVVGSSDGCLANLGCGAIDSTKLALTIGTSGAIRLGTQQPYSQSFNSLFNYVLADNLFITGGPSNNGGNVLEWFIENMLNHKESPGSYNEVLQLAETAPAGAGGLLFLPYINGERAPVWDARARGVFAGLTSQHKQNHLARAVVEATCFALYDIFTSMGSLKDEVELVYASGGFIQSTFWVQVMADIFGKKIVVNDVADASAIGAAAVAMHATGLANNLTGALQLASEGTVYQPGEERHAFYRQLFTVYQRLYHNLKEEMKMLDTISATVLP